jgi:hypothetical protein
MKKTDETSLSAGLAILGPESPVKKKGESLLLCTPGFFLSQADK